MKNNYTFDQKIAYEQAIKDIKKVYEVKYHQLASKLNEPKYLDVVDCTTINAQMDLLRELIGQLKNKKCAKNQKNKKNTNSF